MKNTWSLSCLFGEVSYKKFLAINRDIQAALQNIGHGDFRVTVHAYNTVASLYEDCDTALEASHKLERNAGRLIACVGAPGELAKGIWDRAAHVAVRIHDNTCTRHDNVIASLHFKGHHPQKVYIETKLHSGTDQRLQRHMKRKHPLMLREGYATPDNAL